jgi:effector-binding domain-containing protein
MGQAYIVDEQDFPEMTVLKVRTRDSLMAMGTHIKTLYEQAGMKGLKVDGAIFAIYHEKPQDPQQVDYEMCLPVEGPTEELDKLEDMGGDPCLHLRVKGSYSQFEAAYKALSDFATGRGYEIVGPPREVYTRGPFLGMTFIPTMVTDIYFPIKEKKA